MTSPDDAMYQCSEPTVAVSRQRGQQFIDVDTAKDHCGFGDRQSLGFWQTA
ncbi:hypothetical protein [Haematomicrobium sanguinis]|uniref:hypothetical protein n=1 Tax=Haematomicrobium sanguinis TaxID=479106 RepID=UPI0012F7A10D|nr:hypothetical protein [Haematomicrobium sanguinis]